MHRKTPKTTNDSYTLNRWSIISQKNAWISLLPWSRFIRYQIAYEPQNAAISATMTTFIPVLKPENALPFACFWIITKIHKIQSHQIIRSSLRFAVKSTLETQSSQSTMLRSFKYVMYQIYLKCTVCSHFWGFTKKKEVILIRCIIWISLTPVFWIRWWNFIWNNLHIAFFR